MALSLEAGAEIKNVENAFNVVPSVVDDVVTEGDPAGFQVDISDPTGQFLPGTLTLEILVDFGDGQLQTIYVPSFQPDPEAYGAAAQVIEGDDEGNISVEVAGGVPDGAVERIEVDRDDAARLADDVGVPNLHGVCIG